MESQLLKYSYSWANYNKAFTKKKKKELIFLSKILNVLLESDSFEKDPMYFIMSCFKNIILLIKRIWGRCVCVCVCKWVLLSHQKEWNNAICSNMDATRDYHTKWSKSERDRQVPHDIIYMLNLKYDTSEPIYETHRII